MKRGPKLNLIKKFGERGRGGGGVRVYAIFSNSPWRPSWIVNLHKYEIVPLRDHCDQI